MRNGKPRSAKREAQSDSQDASRRTLREPLLLTYCANVHPSPDLAGVLAALSGPVAMVRDRVAAGPGPSFPVGIWLSGQAVRDLAAPMAFARLAETLTRERMEIATVNAFPFGDFHARAVKRGVYRPDWKSTERLDYTLAVAGFAVRLSREDPVTVSTLPGSFKPWGDADPDRSACAANIARCAEGLARIEAGTGRRVLLCLEPEPWGLVESAAEAVSFFRDFLWRAGNEAAVRRHVGVCLDTCHVQVGFDEPAAAYGALRAAGIEIGKIQVSAALEAPGGAVGELARFDEPVYLHQVTALMPGGARRAFEDLGPFLSSGLTVERARTHFHVPLFWTGNGVGENLATTAPGTARFLRDLAARARKGERMPLLEIETYTWGVLPEPPADARTLADGIAREFAWVRAALGG